jgi:hypothetical protein
MAKVFWQYHSKVEPSEVPLPLYLVMLSHAADRRDGKLAQAVFEALCSNVYLTPDGECYYYLVTALCRAGNTIIALAHFQNMLKAGTQRVGDLPALFARLMKREDRTESAPNLELYELRADALMSQAHAMGVSSEHLWASYLLAKTWHGAREGALEHMNEILEQAELSGFCPSTHPHLFDACARVIGRLPHAAQQLTAFQQRYRVTADSLRPGRLLHITHKSFATAYTDFAKATAAYGDWQPDSIDFHNLFRVLSEDRSVSAADKWNIALALLEEMKELGTLVHYVSAPLLAAWMCAAGCCCCSVLVVAVLFLVMCDELSPKRTV